MTDDPDSSSLGPSPSEGAISSLDVDLVRQGGDWVQFEPIDDLVRRVAIEIASDPLLDVGQSEACIALSTDEHVRGLNRTYRGKDKPTNVLSFPAAEPIEAHGPTPIGDIVLALETVAREAVEQGIAPRDHLTHLVVHGLLHLLGFDHETPSEAEEMEGLETAILARLGVADPYSAPLADEIEA